MEVTTQPDKRSIKIEKQCEYKISVAEIMKHRDMTRSLI